MDSLIKKWDKKEKKYDLLTQELTWKHFWLEVTEIAVGIILAGLIVDGVYPWLKSLVK